MRRIIALVLLCALAAAAAAQDRFFDSGGARIRYVDAGAGAPVLLIHGFTGDIERSWINTGVLDGLKPYYRVIAFDLRGHGHSDKPHDPRAYDEAHSRASVVESTHAINAAEATNAAPRADDTGRGEW